MQADRVALNVSVTSEISQTTLVVEGPVTLEDWEYTCDAGCQSTSSGCAGVVPECDFWLSTSSCSDSASRTFTFDTLFPLGDTASQYGIGIYYGFPVAEGESVCVTARNSGIADVNGWAIQAPAGTPPPSAKERVAIDASVTGDGATTITAATGPLTLQYWQFDCDADCASSSSDCQGETPECDFWLTSSSCQSNATPLFTFANLYPLGDYTSFGPYYGLPLAAGESVCATAKNGGTARVAGWGSQDPGSGVANGTTFGPSPVTVAERMLFNKSATSDNLLTSLVISGPLTLQWWDVNCDASCSTAAAGCGTSTPECEVWISDTSCEDQAPGTFLFDALFPAGQENISEPFDGFPLAADESICVTTRGSTVATVSGWGASTGNPSGDACSAEATTPKERVPFNVNGMSNPTQIETVAQGPLTMENFAFWCDLTCTIGMPGCDASPPPECDIWLTTSSCTEGVTPSFTFGTLFPLNLSGLLFFDGFPVGPGESVCMTAKNAAAVFASGWGAQPGPSVAQIARRLPFNVTFSSETSATQKIADGPVNLKVWQYYCEAGCKSMASGCSSFVPECEVWLSTSNCEASSTPTFTFDQMFPLGNASSLNGTEYVGFPLAQGESVCATVKNTGLVNVAGWGMRP